MKARTVAILAIGVFLLGGACGALYAVLNSNTPSNDKLPVGSYSDLQNQDNGDNQKDNQDNKDNNSVNNDNQDNNQTDNQNNDGSVNNEPDNTTDVSGNNTTKTGEVTVREDSALTLRKGPGTEYERLGQIYRGDSVEILEEQTGWYKVKTYDGVEAWVSADYIEITQ